MWPKHKQSQFWDIIKEIRQEITSVILQLIQNYTRKHKKDQSESFIFCLIFWWFLKGLGGGLLDILISYSKSLITKSFVKMKFFKFYILSVCIRILFVEVKRKFITQNWNWRNTSHNSQIRVLKAFEKLSYICTRFSQQRKKKLDKRWKKVT